MTPRPAPRTPGPRPRTAWRSSPGSSSRPSTGAGGVSSLAHPPADLTVPALAALRELGLQAVEVDCPGHRPARAKELRQWAAALRLAVTGGSDCHGPSGPRRTVGACGVTADEL